MCAKAVLQVSHLWHYRGCWYTKSSRSIKVLFYSSVNPNKLPTRKKGLWKLIWYWNLKQTIVNCLVIHWPLWLTAAVNLKSLSVKLDLHHFCSLLQNTVNCQSSNWSQHLLGRSWYLQASGVYSPLDIVVGSVVGSCKTLWRPTETIHWNAKISFPPKIPECLTCRYFLGTKTVPPVCLHFNCYFGFRKILHIMQVPYRKHLCPNENKDVQIQMLQMYSYWK